MPEAALIALRTLATLSTEATVIVAALAAGLFQQVDVRNLHPFVEGFAHVVDREGGGSNGDQRFHLHASLRGRRDLETKFHPILA